MSLEKQKLVANTAPHFQARLHRQNTGETFDPLGDIHYNSTSFIDRFGNHYSAQSCHHRKYVFETPLIYPPPSEKPRVLKERLFPYEKRLHPKSRCRSTVQGSRDSTAMCTGLSAASQQTAGNKNTNTKPVNLTGA